MHSRICFGLLACLFPMLAHGQLLQLSFSTDNAVFEGNNGVKMSGLISVYVDEIVVKVDNEGGGLITGLAVHKPHKNQSNSPFEFVDLANSGSNTTLNDADWVFEDGDGINLGNFQYEPKISGFDSVFYLVSNVDNGKVSSGIGVGQTATLTYKLDENLDPLSQIYPWLFGGNPPDTNAPGNHINEGWILAARWQEVSAAGTGTSSKVYFNMEVVPEPSQIAFLGVGMLLLPIGVRYLRANRKDRKVQ